MKMKIIFLLSVFILSSVSSAFATGYDGYDTITVKQGESFLLYLNYNEWIDSDGYNPNKLTLTKKERSDPIDGYWTNMYTFKADQKGKTSIKVKIAVLWWEEERTVNVNVV
jgi:hypothetical protein